MKWPRARVWKCSAKARLTAAPPIAPTTGTAWAANFSPATTTKAGGDLGDQPGEQRRAFAGDAPSGEKTRAFGDRPGERGAHREIAALDRRFAGFAAEREDLEAGERPFRLRGVLAFFTRDLGDRAHQDRGQDRRLDPRRWRPRTEAAPADRPGSRRRGLVRHYRGRPSAGAPWSMVPQRHGEGGLQRALGGAAAQAAQRLRQIAADPFDATAEPFGEAGGEAAAVEAADGESEFVEFGARQTGRHDDEGGQWTAPSGSVARRRRTVVTGM